MQDMNKGRRVGCGLLAGTWARVGLRRAASGPGLIKKKKKKKKELWVFRPEYRSKSGLGHTFPIGMIVEKKHVKSGRIWPVTF